MSSFDMQVCKPTAAGPMIISDPTILMNLAGLPPKNGFLTVGMLSGGQPIVLDSAGNLGYLPRGYYISSVMVSGVDLAKGEAKN